MIAAATAPERPRAPRPRRRLERGHRAAAWSYCRSSSRRRPTGPGVVSSLTGSRAVAGAGAARWIGEDIAMNGVRRLFCVGRRRRSRCSRRAAAAASATHLLRQRRKPATTPTPAPNPAHRARRSAPPSTKSEVAAGRPRRSKWPPASTKELVKLETPADDGMTINGAGSGVGGTEIVGPRKDRAPPSRSTLPTAHRQALEPERRERPADDEGADLTRSGVPRSTTSW